MEFAFYTSRNLASTGSDLFMPKLYHTPAAPTFNFRGLTLKPLLIFEPLHSNLALHDPPLVAILNFDNFD